MDQSRASSLQPASELRWKTIAKLEGEVDMEAELSSDLQHLSGIALRTSRPPCSVYVWISVICTLQVHPGVLIHWFPRSVSASFKLIIFLKSCKLTHYEVSAWHNDTSL